MADNASGAEIAAAATAGLTPLTVYMTRNGMDSVDLAAFREKDTRTDTINRGAIFYNLALGLKPGDTLSVDRKNGEKLRFVRLGQGWPLWWMPVPVLVEIPLMIVMFFIGALVL